MVINKRVKRVLLENKAQYIGSILLIVLSCLLFTAMTLTGANMEQILKDFRNKYVQEDAFFTADEEIGNLKELESEADAVIEEGKTFDYTLSEGKTLRIFSKNDSINLPAILEGKELSGGDILLNPNFAAANNYKIGDVMMILDKQFTVIGFMALPNYIYPLQSESDIMFSPQNFGVAVISKDDFEALDKGNDFYAVKYNRADQNSRTQAFAFRELLRSKGVGIEQWTSIEDNKRVSSVTLKLNAINSMSKVMPIAILLLTSILVGNVIGRLIKRECSIIGALYALGYKGKEIYRHYLIFPLTIAVIGGIAGTVLGMLAVHPLMSVLITAFTMPMAGISLNPALISTSLLLPVLFLGCSGWLVIRKELRHSPAELMKGDKEKSRVNFLERVLKLEKLKFTAKYKIREQLRSLSRLAFLLVGCAVATMLLLYGFAIRSSLDYLLTNSMSGTLRFQYEYKYKNLHNEQPPVGAEPFSASLFLPEGGEGRDFYVCGVMPDSVMLSLVDSSGVPISTDKVTITKPLADNLKIKRGDTVNVVRKTDERTFSVKIDSVADTYVGKYIFMPIEAYNEKFGMPQGSYLGIWSAKQLDIPQNQLYSIKSIDESVAAVKDSSGPIQSMIVVYSVIAFIMGMIVIYLVTSMIVEENKNSVSLMKIFGYRKREINSLILNSSTVFVAIGYAIGVPLLLASIGGLLQSLDKSVGLTMPVKLNPLYIAVGFIVIMLTYELSKLMCRKKVNSVSMSEALKAGME